MLPTPCTQPGCGALVKGGGRCPLHKFRPNDLAATKSGGRLYDLARWDALRRLILAGEPLCRSCAREGLDTLADCVDHIVPLDRGGDPWHEGNLQPLCNVCHGLKTAREKLEG